MSLTEIDAALLQKAFLAGAKNLEAKKEWINELNVFPVPDGDTGTNMTMTLMAAAREVAAIEKPTVTQLCKAISFGSLRGARGNSGVILSQLLRGFTKGIDSPEKITTQVLAGAFVRASETAYKAVMKPKEGTILTVARGMADKATELAPELDEIIEFCTRVIEHGDYVLGQTPELLPVLKQAGVVDSGGQGLMQMMKGALDGLMGKELDLSGWTDRPAGGQPLAGGQSALAGGQLTPAGGQSVLTGGQLTPAGGQSVLTGGQLIPVSGRPVPAAVQEMEIHFGYCTEFIINLTEEGTSYSERDEQDFKVYLETIGDSIVVVSDDSIVKVHVHTNDPGLAIQKALTLGSLSNMKIDNMREEHQERLFKFQDQGSQPMPLQFQQPQSQQLQQSQSQQPQPQPRKPHGFVVVSVGDGLSEIFKGIGADYVIEGGQTMNPSTEDLLGAIEQVNADVIYVLPNNKNIILAAEQAKQLAKGKQVVVIPSKTVPQGIAAMINFVPDLSVEENTANLLDEMRRVKTGQITYAVRDTVLEGMEIAEGDIMGIGDEGLLAVGHSIEETAASTLAKLVAEDSELISIYYGAGVSKEDAGKLADRVAALNPDCTVEVHAGGQPVYYYVLSVE